MISTSPLKILRSFPVVCALAMTMVAPPQVWSADKRDLQIYFVDVEGGQATLFVTPDKHSLLIDTGWPGNEGRDADRILSAAKLAGIDRIDYVLLTHYHDDHAGGVPQLVDRIPVGTFLDHGENIDTKPDGRTVEVWNAYQKVIATGKYKRVSAHPGDVFPVGSMKATVVSSDGNAIDHNLPGGGEKNQSCDVAEKKPNDRSENSHSLGVLLTFGKLKILDLGDLTWEKERMFMCPVNRIGKVDILVVSHHGFIPSSSHALVDGIHPRVAIMDNAATKGGNIPVLDTIRNTPGLETLWQLHYSEEGGADHNTAPEYIANPQGPDQGNYIVVQASPKGSFTVSNSGNKQSKTYAAR